MRIPAVVLAVLVASGGCYLGRTPSHKTAAYVANGFLAVGGVAALALPSHGGGSEPCDGCWSGNSMGKVFVGGTLLSIAAIGALMTLVVPTAPEDTKPVVSPRAPITGLVTTPGLRPAAVQLR